MLVTELEIRIMRPMSPNGKLPAALMPNQCRSTVFFNKRLHEILSHKILTRHLSLKAIKVCQECGTHDILSTVQQTSVKIQRRRYDDDDLVRYGTDSAALLFYCR